MSGLLKQRVSLAFLINPFYLYCVSFSLAIFLYLWRWSRIYPELSAGLLLFFAITFSLFGFAGHIFRKKYKIIFNDSRSCRYLNDVIFGLIIFLGIINVISMGYLPVLAQTHDYREFGVPVIDPLFNTLCIFFSVFFFHSFLESRNKKFVIYIFIILLIQIVLYRRSTIVWILTSTSFLYLVYKRNLNLLIILAAFISLPFISYFFGLYGNTRSHLTKTLIMNDLGASDVFKNTNLSANHYMTYLYISSPLANLQKNINESTGFLNNKDMKDFFFYSLIPESVTLRLEQPLNLRPPVCNLIVPHLIAGSFFMISFFTLGWFGMIFMMVLLVTFIVLCLAITKKWDKFNLTTYSLLATTVSLLIFSNFLNRLDVIVMLFVYPVLFHLIYNRSKIASRISSRIPG